MTATAELERSKYEQMWLLADYAHLSPAEQYVDAFIEEANPKPNASLIDLGCGCGRADHLLADKGLAVTRLDITDVGLVDNKFPFIQQPLWEPIPGIWDYGYCCDVMEHIPFEYTMAVLHEISKACREVWFSVAFVDDVMGRHIGQKLHMTVMPYQWWLGKMREIGEVLDARDLLSQGTFFVRCQ